MSANTGQKLATGLLRKPLPIHVISDDLANACIPDEYFRDLLRKSGKKTQTAADLPPTAVIPEQVWNTFAVHAARVNDMSTNHRSLAVIQPQHVFNAIATEAVLCGIGSALMLSPTFIGQRICRECNLGKPTGLFQILEQTDMIFLPDFLDDNVKTWATAEPAAFQDFLNTLRLIKYGARRMVIYDMSTAVTWSDTATQGQLKDVYGVAGAALIMSDLHTV